MLSEGDTATSYANCGQIPGNELPLAMAICPGPGDAESGLSRPGGRELQSVRFRAGAMAERPTPRRKNAGVFAEGL